MTAKNIEDKCNSLLYLWHKIPEKEPYYLKNIFQPKDTVIPLFDNSSIMSTALFNSGARVTILTFSTLPYTSWRESKPWNNKELVLTQNIIQFNHLFAHMFTEQPEVQL